VRSLPIKLSRRTLITSADVRGGRVIVSGRLVPPLTHPRTPVVIRRQLDCGRDAVVARVQPRANGTFHASLPLPSGVRAAIYKASSGVVGNPGSTRSSPTFSLAIPVALR
jgi:hypothetical protein